MATKARVSAYTRNEAQASFASPVMTLREAALFLRCGIGQVRRLCHGGKLRWQQSGKRWIVLRSEVETLLDKGWRRAGDR